ncbi:Cytochrome b5-like heme/steroid binding domain-containing protein [Rhodotorula toruloides]|nr:Cytochrome b5-like heme/steroid binding domain-containing protein [Rhodotorula toruloides]
MIRTCLLFATRPRCTTFRRTSPRFDLFPLAFSHTPSLVSPPSAFADPRRPITACRHLHFATKQCRSLTSLDFVRFAPSCTTAAPREFAPLGLPSLATLSRLCMPLAAVQRDTRRQPIAHRQVARRRSCRVFTGLVSLALVALALFALARLLLSSNTMSKVITAEEVAKHNTAESAWVIIEGGVYDVTDFLEDHPGGKKVLLKGCGQDSTEKFHSFHSRKVLDKTAKPYLIGKVGEASKL